MLLSAWFTAGDERCKHFILHFSISKPISQRGLQYLVLWKGYRKEEASWVQKEGELAEQFIADLYSLADKCEF